MPDSYTETTQRGFFSRLGGSFAGLLIGPILVIVAIGLLWWNEGRAVQAIVGLGDAASAVVEVQPGAVSPANDGKLVHVVGPATARAKIADADTGISFDGQVAVARTAEMYQWKQKEDSHTQTSVGGGQTTTTTYTYEKAWSDMPVDSSGFKHPEGHANPQMPFKSTRLTASDAKLGGYTLDAATLGLADLQQTLNPDAPAGWKRDGDHLYKGDPAAPNVGDMRIAYQGLASGATLSVLAAQSSGGFAPFVTPNGYSIDLVTVGSAPAATMIANKKKSEATLTWILRGVGALAMFIGFMLFLGPLSTLASVLPFLGGIVRGASAAIAFVIAVPLTLVVIALAWFGHRPLIGGGLLLLAAAAFYGLWRWHKGRTPAHDAKAAA
jgi:Transmembrane protein 43